MKNILEQLKDVSNIQDIVEEKLAGLSSEGEAGGGLVRLKLNGRKELLEIHIDESLCDKAQCKMLCDLIIAAHSITYKKVDEQVKELPMSMDMDLFSNFTKS